MKDMASIIEDTNLQMLILDQNPIEDKGLSVLKDSLTKNYSPSIKKLSFENCELGHAGVIHLFKAMTSMVNMTSVNLSGNNFIDATFYPLRSWYGSHLSVIKLNHCWLGEKALKSLAEIVRESPSLLTLQLRNNHLGKENFKVISDALASPKSHLEILDLTDNNLTDDGITMIARSLKTNRSL